MKVFFWQGDNGGCGHYRCKFMAEGLATRGHTTRSSIRWNQEWQNFDVVVGQRIAMPGPSTLWGSRSDVFRVYEVDDDLFRVPAGNPAAAFYGDPEVQKLMRMNMQAADRIVTSTDALAERMQQETGHADVRVVPNYIPERALVPVAPNRPFSIGWSGSPTHRPDWPEAEHSVRRWLRRNPDVPCVLIGDDPFHEKNVTAYPWVRDVEEHWSWLDKFAVGLAPLRPSIFNRSKSHLKALEYAARGIPTLASDTGPYPSFVRDGSTGLLIRHQWQWAQELRFMTENPAFVARLGQNALAQARMWTTEGNADTIEKGYLP